MTFVDGFVFAVPTANKADYLVHTRAFDEFLMRTGALRVVECWGADVPHGKQTDFFRAVAAREDETVCFGWIEWPDRATRDAAHAKVDAAIASGELAGDHAQMPFDGSRMVLGGFEPMLMLGGAA